MKSSLTTTFLFLSGLLLLIIGSAILLIPHVFYANDGILLGRDPSLLSEIRASGGLLTGGALLILTGAVRPTLRLLAMTINILIYGSFGLSRLLGLAMDGMPSSSLLMATVVELTVAFIGLIILYRQPQDQFDNKLTTLPNSSITHRRPYDDSSKLSNLSHLLRSH